MKEKTSLKKTDWASAIAEMRILEPRWYYRFIYQDRFFMEALAQALADLAAKAWKDRP